MKLHKFDPQTTDIYHLYGTLTFARPCTRLQRCQRRLVDNAVRIGSVQCDRVLRITSLYQHLVLYLKLLL